MRITDPIWALGAMSGTSLDGVDAAMILTDGGQIFEFGQTDYRAYSDEERQILRAALGCWPDAPEAARAAQIVEDAHIQLLSEFEGAALVGFHGQTLAHDPGGRGTHQAGDGARLARQLQLPVVWDFRSTDVKKGGQGAPLAPFYHYACAQKIGASDPVAFLNLGGVGNLTYVDPRVADITKGVMAFDTGPANAPVNDLVFARRGLSYDENGALAAQGVVNHDIVARFLANPYFHKPPPKSLDRDGFALLSGAVDGLSDADACATLIACASLAVARGMVHMPTSPAAVYVTGGGRRNTFFMQQLQADLAAPVHDIDQAGLDGDMLEAQAFAYLAVRVARGLPTSCPATTGVATPVVGGIVSQP